MANEVKKVNGIAVADIKNINGQTDDNIKELNGEEFAGLVPGPNILFTRDSRGGLGSSYSGLNNLDGSTTTAGDPPMKNGWTHPNDYADAIGFIMTEQASTPNFRLDWLWFPCLYPSSGSGSGLEYKIRICEGLTGEDDSMVYDTAGTFSPKVQSLGFEKVLLPITGTVAGSASGLVTGTQYQIMVVFETNWTGTYAFCNRTSHTVSYNSVDQVMTWAAPVDVDEWGEASNGSVGTTTTHGNLFGFAVTMLT